MGCAFIWDLHPFGICSLSGPAPIQDPFCSRQNSPSSVPRWAVGLWGAGYGMRALGCRVRDFRCPQSLISMQRATSGGGAGLCCAPPEQPHFVWGTARPWGVVTPPPHCWVPSPPFVSPFLPWPTCDPPPPSTPMAGQRPTQPLPPGGHPVGVLTRPLP